MDVTVLALLHALGVLFPTFPLSLPASFLLQKFRKLRGIILITMPLVGFFLYALVGKPTMPDWTLIVGMFSSVLYAFKSISVKSVNRWMVYHYVSVLSLIWVFLSRAEINLVFIMGIVLPFIMLNMVLNYLETRFGSTHTNVIQGIGSASPLISLFLTLSILFSVALPTAPLFFNVIAASLLLNSHEFVALGTVWLLWGWSGVKLLTRVITGKPKDNLLYEDIDPRTILLMSVLSITTLLMGFTFLEVLL